MYDDPFDQLCLVVARVVNLIGGTLDLFLKLLCVQGSYRFRMVLLSAGFWMRTGQRHIRLFLLQGYYSHIRVYLTVFGLVKPLTWADVEAYRLRCMARSGCNIPRPAELEAGLREEQMQQQHLFSSPAQEPHPKVRDSSHR